MEHDLPDLSSDLAQQQQWQESVDNDCREAVGEAGCLTLDVQVYEKDAQGNLTPITSPGPDYGNSDNPYYTDCPVTEMDPLSSRDGGPEKIPAGTTIRVTVVCIPAESTETNSPGNG